MLIIILEADKPNRYPCVITVMSGYTMTIKLAYKAASEGLRLK